jgi:sugar phosphate isomerase/epimerase
MKFALQDQLLQHNNNYEMAFQAAKEIGFDGLEINFFGKPLDASTAKKLASASEKSGIPISAMCGGYQYWIGHFEEEKRLTAVKDIQTSLKFLSEIGAGGLIAPAAYGMFSKKLPPFQPPRDSQGDEQALLDSLKRISETADQYNITLLLEPLNRYEDHMINTVEYASSLANKIGSNQIKVMADFFHMNIEEADTSQTIQKHFLEIGYYHLADSNRLQPGMGHTDFLKPLEILQKLQYKGFLSLECQVLGERRESLVQSLLHLKKSIN